MMPRNSGLQDSKLENWNSALRFDSWNIRTLFKPDEVGTLIDEVENTRTIDLELLHYRK